MSAKLNWLHFYPRDWYSDPRLAVASPATRGIWIDLLCAMFIEGTDSISNDIETLARTARCDVTAMKRFVTECERHRFADVTESDGIVTLVSRRLSRERAAIGSSTERTRKWRERERAKSNSLDIETEETVLSQSVTCHTPVSVSVSSLDLKILDQEKDKEDHLTADDLREGWNEHCAILGLPKVEMLSATRRQKAQARLREHKDVDFWNVVFGRISGSPFLLGHQKTNGDGKHKNWKANFDWLIDNDTNCVKVFEGRYVNE